MKQRFRQKPCWPKKNLLALFLMMLFVVMAGNINAQEQVLTGKILSKEGTALPGATVMVKGTTRGVVTDVNGNFSISVSPGDVIVVTYVGFITQEIPVDGQANISIALSEETNKLKEVTVTALGIEKDTKTIGYSTSEVTGNDLVKARDANAIDGLVGKVAGLSVGASSEFMGTPQLVLRGNTNLLFVVDGVPINSDTWNINADDVESYTVLKGPNAGALYGSRGQNGAILVTTKKGNGVKGVTVEFNSSDMYDPKSFLAVPVRQNEYGIGSNYMYVFANDPYNLTGQYGRQPVWGPRMEGQPVAQYNSPLVNGVRQGTPFKVLGADNFYNFMENGYHTSNSLSVNATGEKYDLRVSLSNVFQKGLDPNTWLNITNGNIYAGYSFSKRLRFDGNVNYNYQNTPNIPDVVYGPQSYTYMIQEYGSANYDIRDFKNYWATPGIPGVQQKWAEYGRANNPYFMANQWLRGHHKTDVYGYGKVTYSFTPDLNLCIRSQVSGYNLLRTEIMPTSAITYSLSSGGIQEGAKTGEYREDRRSLYDNNNDILLTFNKNVTPDLYVSALAGGNLRTFQYNSSWASTNNILVPSDYNLTNSLNPIVAYNFNSNMNVYSGYYSIDLGYKKYFTISTTGREDYSTVFYTGQRADFYPSGSLSTVISDYVKMPENIISFLKLRGSISDVKTGVGLTSPTIGPSFDALGQTSPLGYGTSYYSSYDGPTYNNQNTYTIGHNYNNMPNANYTNIVADPALKAFPVVSGEFGGDMKFLNNKIGLGVTYFTTKNGPAIFQEQVAASTGYYYKNVNGITTTKNGWEVQLTGSPVKDPNGLSWDFSINYSTFVEKLKSIYKSDKAVYLNGHYYKDGDRLDAIYGYKFFRSPSGQIINGSDGLPLKPTVGPNNEQLLGYANPDFVWSFNNKIGFKAFSLGFQFDGRVGGKIFDEIYADMYQSGNATDLVNGDMGAARLAEWNDVKANNYTIPNNYQGQYTGPGVVVTSGSPNIVNGVITNLNSLTFAPNQKKIRLQSYIGGVNTVFQEPFMVSKSYAMLREVILTYNLPSRLLTKSFIKRASISAVGRNLLYLTTFKRKDVDVDQYPVGFDVSKIGQSKNQAVNSNGYGDNNLNLITNAGMQTPIVRQFGCNINIVF